jgi:hypothetical protein
MYDIDETGEPVGVVNDFDLATWVDHSTTNNDRTGTIPFMAIDLLDGGLEKRIPRLYRHDMESFSWILAYISVAKIEYKGSSIKASSYPDTDCETWFQDGDTRRHVDSKKFFHENYGRMQGISARYYRYSDTIQRIAKHWHSFHKSREPKKHSVGPAGLGEPELKEPEADDPAGSVKLFIESLDAADGREEFAKIKARLLEAIGAEEAVNH